MTGLITIETERLLLRRHRVEDFEAVAAMWRDREVARHIGGAPSSREEVWARLLRYAGHWAMMGFGFYAIEEKETGRFVGETGFAYFHRDLGRAFDDAPEIGWVLAHWAHGQGYATEAVSAVVDDAGWGRSVCMITPDNKPSRRVAAKCGYTEFGRAIYKGNTVLLYDRYG